MKISHANSVKGAIRIPGDKSISHRAVMFGSLANGLTEVTNFLKGADCLSTISCFQKMGIEIENKKDCVYIHGKGMHGLKEPVSALDVGNSGTTMRLISGILAPQKFASTLTGDDSIQKRPMKRVITPLSFMGSRIKSIEGTNCAPLLIPGDDLKGIHYTTSVASAQIKSSILLAGLYADGPTSVTEPALSRNHTELMLSQFGAQISAKGFTTTIQPCDYLIGQQISVPGDISSASYFIAAALLLPNSEVLIQGVGINPTRNGILKACEAMGADITLLNVSKGGKEPVADLLVKSSSLHGTVIEGSLIPTLIDEIPVLAVLACFAEGKTIIKDAAELKVKESNRIDVMVENLAAMGAHIEGTDDGMIIEGGAPLHGASIDSHMDHRIAMSFAIAALAADGETDISGFDCVKISYPSFFETLHSLICS